MGSNIEQTTSTGQTTTQQQAPSYMQPYLQQYNTDVLSGGYLNRNPHLDATFNRAADVVQNRLGTQYASAGRNLSAMRNPQSQELNDLATQIYGGNYQAERDRMQGVANANPTRTETSNMSSSNPMYTNDWSSLLGGLLGVGAIDDAFGFDWGSLLGGGGASSGGGGGGSLPGTVVGGAGAAAGGVNGAAGGAAGGTGTGGAAAGGGAVAGGGAAAGSGGTAAGGAATGGGAAAGGIGSGSAGFGAAAGTAAIIAAPAILGMLDLQGNESFGDSAAQWAQANNMPLLQGNLASGRGSGQGNGIAGTWTQLPDGRYMNLQLHRDVLGMDQSQLNQFLSTWQGDQVPTGVRLDPFPHLPNTYQPSGGGILTPGTRFNGRVAY